MVRVDAIFWGRCGWQSRQVPLISSYAVVRTIWTAPDLFCGNLKHLNRYRMRFGPAINGGSRASVCEKWLYAFLKTSKYWNLRDRFRPSEPCAACGRPVYNLKGWKVTSVFCSSSCADLSGFRRKPSRVKLQNPITSSFTRCFSGTIIACQSAMGLDLHPAGIESAAV